MAYPLPSPVAPIGDPYSGSHGASAPQNWESRNAYDLPAKKGTPVYAVDAGVIGDQIGYQSGGPKDTGRFAGQRLTLTTGNNAFFYGHLSRLVVKAGEHVVAGQLLGYSGVANGVAHLHFAAKNGDPLVDIGDSAHAQPGSQPPAPAAQQPPMPVTSVPQEGQVGDPYSTPPPTSQPQVGAPGPVAPGTVGADSLSPRLLLENWQQIASQSGASPEAQSYLQIAQTAASGG
jgi:murein DD-endopeptidase MepM/ murein hydrolase activator NlpD